MKYRIPAEYKCPILVKKLADMPCLDYRAQCLGPIVAEATDKFSSWFFIAITDVTMPSGHLAHHAHSRKIQQFRLPNSWKTVGLVTLLAQLLDPLFWL